MRVLYHFALSPFSRKIRLVLAEKRLPFELREERVWERRPEFLALNPAGQVPVLVEDSGLVVPDSAVITEYLEETYREVPLIGATAAERVETRRLVAWFDGKFAREVTDKLLVEKVIKRLIGRGVPDASAIRAGYGSLRTHLSYVAELAESRRWLAGETLSVADLAAAAHLSVLDFAGEIDWSVAPAAKEWYARIKSRPSFRPLLGDRVPGLRPPDHYADLDF